MKYTVGAFINEDRNEFNTIVDLTVGSNLEQIIAWQKKEGFEFVKIGELDHKETAGIVDDYITVKMVKDGYAYKPRGSYSD